MRRKTPTPEATYRHRSGPQEVKVCVFPKQVTLRVSGVKLLSSHYEMAGKVVSCKKRLIFKHSYKISLKGFVFQLL